MNTLIVLSSLVVVVLLLEIINFRKGIVPFTVLGLAVALGANYCKEEIIQFESHDVLRESLFSQSFSALLIILTGGIVAMGHRFYSQQKSKMSDFISLKIFTLIGAICMIMANHMVMFFIGLEILSISLYILASSKPKDIFSNESGMKYFLMGSFASGFVLFGIALIYGATASFNFSDIYESILAEKYLSKIWFSLGGAMILIGMFFKIAAFPFHFWAPDVYQGAPTLTTASMSTVAKIASMAFLYEFAVLIMPFNKELYHEILILIAVATMFVGNILALKQKNIKRILAYSGISHAGFMLLTLLYAGNDGQQDLFYYTAAYSTAGIAAFAVVLYATLGGYEETVESYAGFGKKNPFMGAVMTLALLSMAGIPILSGFFAKFIVLQSLFSEYLLVALLAIINSIISVYYYFRLILSMYTPKEDVQKTNLPAINAYSLVAFVFILLNILIGIFPNCLLDMIVL